MRSVSWSETVTLYRDEECGSSRAEVIAIRSMDEYTHSKVTTRRVYQCETDAIIRQNLKKRNEHTLHLEKILPELAKLQWSHLSLLEMEAVESEIIEELDSLRQIDRPNSREYKQAERQLSLLLEAYNCLFKLNCANNLGSIKQGGKNKEATPIHRKHWLLKMRWLVPFKNCAFLDADTDAESG